MTETPTQTQSSISELEAALRESKRAEHALAVETDEMPERIRAAARAHARRLADAARKGKDALRKADNESEVGGLHQREKELPYLRWSQAIRTAALEVELAEAQEATHLRDKEAAREALPAARQAMVEGQKLFDEARKVMQMAETGADYYSGERAQAQKRLTKLEQEYPEA
jgi:hypothetical protein